LVGPRSRPLGRGAVNGAPPASLGTATGTPADRAIRGYLAHLAVERGSSANTIAAYRRDLQRYAEFLAGRRIALDEVAAADVAAFQRSLTEGDEAHQPLAASSVARMLVAVRGLHRFMAGEQPGGVDPAASISLPKQGIRLPKALTIDQVQALLGACDLTTTSGLRDRALLELLYGTGARVSEVCDLDVDDVANALADENAGVRLIGKGDKERLVPLGSFARAAVDAWLVRGRPDWSIKGPATPALLLNSRGARLGRQSAWSILQETAERAGLGSHVSPHSLRHSYATHLLQGGADVRVVQELLGHASVTTTQIYTLVTVDHLREVYLTAHPRAY